MILRPPQSTRTDTLCPYTTLFRSGAALTARHLVGVHAKTGRTAGLTPFESGFGEDAIKPLRLRLPLNKAGAWNDERLLDTASQTMPLHHVRGSAQILDTAVGTASNEDEIGRAHV